MGLIRGVSISDIHLGNNRVTPEVIHRNLNKYLYPELVDIDILILGGDFFHTLLNLNSSAAYYAILIINEIVELSIKHDFLVRVLKGTFEHDRDQNKYFNVDNKYDHIKLINTLSIEHIEKLNINICYVPDDLPYKNAQAEIVKKIKDQQLEQVDMLVLHSYCKHEIPKDAPIEPNNLFDIDFLIHYVKGPILKGHIHTKSVYKTCINNGSFERLTHGQEEKKGFFKFTYDREKFTYKFIENKDTAIFSSITLGEENYVETFIKCIENIISKVNEDTPLPINIRIICNKVTKNKFNPYDFDFKIPIRYSTKLIDAKIIQTDTEDMFLVLNDLPKINRGNLATIISDFIGNKLPANRVEEILLAEE